MPDDGTEFRISALYGFVRARPLEGTFPGDAATGVWPITALRIGYGGAFCQMMSGHSRLSMISHWKATKSSAMAPVRTPGPSNES